MGKNVLEINEAAFENEVKKQKGYVLVDFWASWCAPCNMLAPILERVAGTLSDKLKVCKLNVDENHALASEFEVMSIPTLIMFKDGKEEARMTGFIPETELSKKIKGYLEL